MMKSHKVFVAGEVFLSTALAAQIPTIKRVLIFEDQQNRLA